MWLRKVQVIVTQKDDPSKKAIFERHRIDFEIRSTVGWPADTANITLFNLSLEEVKFLQSKQYGDMYIEIRAGYGDEQYSTGVQQYKSPTNNNSEPRIEINNGADAILPTLFSGIITNAVGFRRPPEHVTQLFCISKAYGAATDFKQLKAIPPKSTLKQAIESMCNDYGFNTISTFGITSEQLSQVLPRGRTFRDTFLIEFKNLLSEYNMLYSVTTGEVQVFSDSYGDKDAVNRMSKDREPIKLDANSVIGNPIAGICTYNLKTFLNPAIQPGMILDVSPLLGEELLVNGVTSISGSGMILNTDQSVFRWAMEDKYFIVEVVHFGSTHGMEFQTSVSALLGGNTSMGNKETSWQDWYANSGMAMESF